MKDSFTITAVLAAVACAVGAFLAAPVPEPAEASGPAAAPAPELLEGRVALAVVRRGWPPMRAPALARDATEVRFGGGAIPAPPIYPAVLAAAARRAAPDVGYAMTPPDQRPAAQAPVADARERAADVVRAAPRVSIALAALAAALAAAAALRSLLPGATPREVALVAVAGGLGVGLYPAVRVVAELPGALGQDAFAAAMVALGLWATLRALRDDRIDRPVGSAFRGGAAGVAFGLAIGSFTPAFAPLVGVQVGLAARLLSRTRRRGPDGAVLRARGLPIFATSLHKTALLVLLPALVESPLAVDAPWSAAHLSWLHFCWLAVVWFAFAPFALAPRLASLRPPLAVAPAAALGALLLGAVGVLAHPGAFLGAGAAMEPEPPLAVATFGIVIVAPAALALALAAPRTTAGLVAFLALVAAMLAALGDVRTLCVLAPAMAPAAVAFAPRSILGREGVRSR